MRRLRDRLIAATVPLILLLLAATWLVQDNLLRQLSKTLADRVSRSDRLIATLSESQVGSLYGHARQLNNSAALREALTTYLEVRRRVDEARRGGQDPASMHEELSAAESSLRDDVGPTEVEAAGVDLAVLTDLEGRILVSLRGPGKVTNHTAEDAARSLGEEPLVRTILDEVKGRQPASAHLYGLVPVHAAAGYFIYADGRLYLATATALMRGSNIEGVLLLGTRDVIPASNDLEIACVANGKVLDSRMPSDAGGAAVPMTARAQADLAAFVAAWAAPAIAPPDAGKATPSLPLVNLVLDGRKFLALPHPLWEEGRPTPIAWSFLMLPTDRLLKPVEDSRLFVAGLGGAVLLVAALVVVVLAARISRPIEELSRKMEAVGQGELDVQAEVRGDDEVATLARSFNHMVDGLREKEQLAAYVPEKARDAIAEAKGRLALAPKRVKASVLFSDLRGFTTLSEKLDPSQVVELLNEYLEEMQRVINTHRGYISDYIGDAIVAVFTEEESTTRSGGCSHRCVRCALDMQEALAGLRRTSTNPTMQTLHMGIGINTGYLVEGDMGPQSRLKYAVIGDTVNTAARIQDRSKEGRHTCVLISGVTQIEVQNEIEAVFFGDEMLKGKSASVAIWEIVGRRTAGVKS